MKTMNGDHMSTKYWENETPWAFDTSKNAVQYYPVAEKLSVARPMWKDDSGKERRGKSITLDIAALLESGADTIKIARTIFADLIDYIDQRLEVL